MCSISCNIYGCEVQHHLVSIFTLQASLVALALLSPYERFGSHTCHVHSLEKGGLYGIAPASSSPSGAAGPCVQLWQKLR